MKHLTFMISIHYLPPLSYLWEDVTRAWIVPQISSLSSNHAQTLPILHSYDSTNTRLYSGHPSILSQTYAHTYSHPFSQTLIPGATSFPNPPTKNYKSRRAKSYGRTDDFGFHFSAEKPFGERNFAKSQENCVMYDKIPKNDYSQDMMSTEQAVLAESYNNYDNTFLGNIYDNHIPNEYEYHMNYPVKRCDKIVNKEINNIQHSKHNGRPANSITRNNETAVKPPHNFTSEQHREIYYTSYPVKNAQVLANNLPPLAHDTWFEPRKTYQSSNHASMQNIPVQQILPDIYSQTHNHIYQNHQLPRHDSKDHGAYEARKNFRHVQKSEEVYKSPSVKPPVRQHSSPASYHSVNPYSKPISINKYDEKESYSETREHILNKNIPPQCCPSPNYFKPISPKKRSVNCCRTDIQHQNSRKSTPVKQLSTEKSRNSPSRKDPHCNTRNEIKITGSSEAARRMAHSLDVPSDSEYPDVVTVSTNGPKKKPPQKLEMKRMDDSKIISPRNFRSSHSKETPPNPKGFESTPNMENLRDGIPSPNFEAWASSRAVFVMPPSRFMDEPAYSSTF